MARSTSAAAATETATAKSVARKKTPPVAAAKSPPSKDADDESQSASDAARNQKLSKMVHKRPHELGVSDSMVWTASELRSAAEKKLGIQLTPQHARELLAHVGLTSPDGQCWVHPGWKHHSYTEAKGLPGAKVSAEYARARYDEVFRLRHEGLQPAQIAERLAIPRVVVQTWCAEGRTERLEFKPSHFQEHRLREARHLLKAGHPHPQVAEALGLAPRVLAAALDRAAIEERLSERTPEGYIWYTGVEAVEGLQVSDDYANARLIEAFRLSRKGLSASKIGKQLVVPRAVVEQWLEVGRHGALPKSHFAEQQDEEAVRLIAAGVSRHDVAAALGMLRRHLGSLTADVELRQMAQMSDAAEDELLGHFESFFKEVRAAEPFKSMPPATFALEFIRAAGSMAGVALAGAPSEHLQLSLQNCIDVASGALRAGLSHARRP